jgi:hypothetical protein
MPDKVFQVVVNFGQQVPTKEALIVAPSEDEAKQLVTEKLDSMAPSDGALPSHIIEVEEMTPDYIETLYLSSVETDSPFYGQVDWQDVPKRIVDILLPKTSLDLEAARSNIRLMRAGKPPIAIQKSPIITKDTL